MTERAGTSLRQAAAFFAVSLGLAVVVAASAPVLGADALLLTMFTPLVSVVVCRAVCCGWSGAFARDLGLSRLGLSYWPFAMVVPLAVLLPGYVVVWASGVGEFAPPPPDVGFAQTAIRLAVSVVLGAMLGALGEEIGWRGHLLPRLVDACGPVWGAVLTGLLHGIWHVPLIVMTPYYLASVDPVLAVPAFLVLMSLTGPIYAHVRFASGSILPVAVMHRAWNTYLDGLSGATRGPDDRLTALLVGETGVTTILAMALVAVLVLRLGRSAA